jgi:hypothetical protein
VNDGPYIVVHNRPPQRSGSTGWEISVHGCADLVSVRGHIQGYLYGEEITHGSVWKRLDDLTTSGGRVACGDGTVFEVQAISWLSLAAKIKNRDGVAEMLTAKLWQAVLDRFNREQRELHGTG